MTVPIERQVECVERELKLRRRVYPRRVSEQKMTQRFAAEEIEAMESVLDDAATDCRERAAHLKEVAMLQFTKQVMRLTGLNVRRELAGKNPADGRTASDLKLVVKGSNDLLDKLSPHLRGSFYQADVDKQGVLVPHALTKRMHPLLQQENLAYDLKCAGYAVTIDHAGNEESAIVLDGCAINEFRLNLEEGGTVAITMRAQFHPDLGQLDPLADKLQQEVIVTMTPPKVPVKAEKREPDLIDAAQDGFKTVLEFPGASAERTDQSETENAQ